MLNFAGTIFKLIFPLLHLKKARAVKFAKTMVTPIFLIFTAGVLRVETAHTLPKLEKIHIYYDARKEFHSGALLSTITSQISAHHKSYSEYAGKHVQVTYSLRVAKPQCRSSDQICAQYVAYVESHVDKITNALHRRSSLFGEMYSAQQQIHIHKENISYIMEETQKEQKLKENFNDLQHFLIKILNNQEAVMELLTAFEQYMIDIGKEIMDTGTRIEEARIWIQAHSTTDSYKIFEQFIDYVDSIYKTINNSNDQMFSSFYNFFSIHDPETLYHFSDFIFQMCEESSSRIVKLNERLSKEQEKINNLVKIYQSANNQVEQVLNSVKNHSKKLIYPARLDFNGCRRC